MVECWNDGEEAEGSGDQGPGNAIVFNGEIYNFRELREELEAGGEGFSGNSDTEVLLRLLSRDGAGCLPRLAGMFAFCLVNEAKGEALLARDAFGIKPLYYRIDEGTLAFASEAGLLRTGGDPVDVEALRDYFLWGSVPEPKTLAAPVRQIPAGHCLLFRYGEREARLIRWHEPRPRPPVRRRERSDSVRATRTALEESVRRHLVSDVPVGIFLSGGLDSTAVLALAREVLGPGAELRTFTIGFAEAAYDESDIARRTAAHFGARHTEWRMTAAEGAHEIPGFLEAMDQPTLDGFNTWCVAKLASREGMKVVLSGIGGDEWFSGYESFVQVPRFHALHRGLGPARPLAAALLGLTPPGSRWRRLATFLRGERSWLGAYHVQRGIFTPGEADRLVRSMAGPGSEAPDGAFLGGDEETGPLTPAERVGVLETGRYLRNQLLRDGDVFSMAQGLELRTPLVDVRLAASLLELPPGHRLEPGKRLLLDAVPEIPEWVRNRPKRGFRFPFREWIEGGFGSVLSAVSEDSPVVLNSWYRTWTLAAARHRLRGRGNGLFGGSVRE